MASELFFLRETGSSSSWEGFDACFTCVSAFLAFFWRGEGESCFLWEEDEVEMPSTAGGEPVELG
jgi:hypothetical protein